MVIVQQIGPLLGVVLAMLLTTLLSRNSERKQDIRARLMLVASEIVALLGELRTMHGDLSHYASRGGGRIMPAGSTED